MKKTLLTLIAVVAATSVLAQGRITFATKVTSDVNQTVYAPQTADPTTQQTGNTTGNNPAGTQVYTGAALTGSGWTAELWSAPGSTIPTGTTFKYGNIDGSL